MKITVEIRKEVYEMLSMQSAMRKMPVEKVIEALVEKFAPVSHTMIEEELMRGYVESGDENLDWANL